MGHARETDVRKSVADELPVGVVLIRVEGGEPVYANRAFVEMVGDPSRLALFTRDGEPYPEDATPQQRALREERTITADDAVLHQGDGGSLHVRVIAKPVPARQPTHVMVVLIDAGREAEAALALAESEARLRRVERLESVGNLTAGVAHDFNNLLAAVKVIAGKLALGEQDEQRRRDLAAIDEVTERARRLTKALLEFAGRGHLATSRVSLNDIVTSVAALLSRAFDRRIAIELDLRASRDVAGDLTQLEQVVMNLAVNARDAMPGGGTLRLRTYDAGEGEIALEVSDTGPGVDPAIRDKIFEPYFSTKNGDGGGSGLGLSTVRRVVESHGGRVELDDNDPQGTTMRVLLRAGRASLPSEPPPPVDVPGSDVVEGSGLVLVVDDEESVRLATRVALETLGYGVLTASTGGEAVDMFRERRDELVTVVLDLCMPITDGRDTYLRLREIDEAIPVLLTTGYPLNDEIRSLLDLGIAAFLEKPYGIQKLSHAVAGVARKR